MRYSVLASALIAPVVRAWLPMDRDLAAFNQTTRFAELGKRFEPSLPNGVTKIRGVNFGGMFELYFIQRSMNTLLTRDSRMAGMREVAANKRVGHNGLRRLSI